MSPWFLFFISDVFSLMCLLLCSIIVLFVLLFRTVLIPSMMWSSVITSFMFFPTNSFLYPRMFFVEVLTSEMTLLSFMTIIPSRMSSIIFRRATGVSLVSSYSVIVIVNKILAIVAPTALVLNTISVNA